MKIDMPPGDLEKRYDETAHARAVERVEGSFREIYLTLVSIIQGVALGFLMQVIGADYHNIGVDKAGRLVALFLVIVVIWQEYAVGSTMYAWIPGPVDTLAPFLLGAGECVMIAALDSPIEEFLLLTTLTWAVGLVAAINYAVHAARARLETTRESQKVLAMHPRTLPILDAIGLIGVIAMLSYSASSLPQPHPAVFSWFLVTLLVGLFGSCHWRWTRPMQPQSSRITVTSSTWRSPASRRRTPRSLIGSLARLLKVKG